MSIKESPESCVESNTCTGCYISLTHISSSSLTRSSSCYDIHTHAYILPPFFVMAFCLNVIDRCYHSLSFSIILYHSIILIDHCYHSHSHCYLSLIVIDRCYHSQPLCQATLLSVLTEMSTPVFAVLSSFVKSCGCAVFN